MNVSKVYVVNAKMMPAEEPHQSEHKIVFEIDYSHFTSFHGWIQLLQLVSHRTRANDNRS